MAAAAWISRAVRLRRWVRTTVQARARACWVRRARVTAAATGHRWAQRPGELRPVRVEVLGAACVLAWREVWPAAWHAALGQGLLEALLPRLASRGQPLEQVLLRMDCLRWVQGRGRGKRLSQGSQGSARSARGRGRGQQSYMPPRSTSIGVDLNLDSQPNEDDEVEEINHGNTKQGYDKADWTFDNTRAFCEICIQEINAGNRANGIMSSRDYKNIAEKYKIATGLHHSKVQLKNKLDFLKGLYGFWLQLNKDTGLGWNEVLGNVTASEEYRDSNTKGHSNWKQLKKGPSEHEDLLQEMFGGIVVGGSSACAPGELFGANDEEGCFEEDDSDAYASPPTSSYAPNRSLPRNHATTSTASSPVKPRNQMVKVMQSIHATLKENCKIANKVMLDGYLFK